MERKPSREPLLPWSNTGASASAREPDHLPVDVVACLRSAGHGDDLGQQLGEVVGATGWSEALARNVLAVLERALKDGRETMGPAMRDAYDKAIAMAELEFGQLVQTVKHHPTETVCAVFLTVVALGVLAVLAPYILELLGFGELGPIAGEVFPASAHCCLFSCKLLYV
ncbi:hypothetical protein E4U41_003275 [Claviceps citrina]|nr:hypothetical protein E4U41_003275 [Claviceps citrina]